MKQPRHLRVQQARSLREVVALQALGSAAIEYQIHFMNMLIWRARTRFLV